MKITTILTFLLLSAMTYQCVSPIADGGSSDHGSGRCAGIIINSYGDPAEGAKIMLLPDTMNYAADSASGTMFETITDAHGVFQFDSLPCGTYCLSGTDDGWSQGMFAQQSIRVGRDSTIDLDSIHLSEAGSVSFNIDTLGIPAGTILYFPGLPLYHFVDTSRNQSIYDIPAGSLTLRGYDPVRDSSFELGIEYSIEILPGMGLFLRPFRLPRPWHVIDSVTTEQKLDNGETDSVYLFNAVDPLTRKPSGPCQYRFSWGDGTISAWSDSPRARYAWKKTGHYFVQTQLLVDENICLAWSESIVVKIRKPE